jgi:hypothetical protein
MELRDWVPYSGWPIRIGDLASYIDRSAKHLGLGAGNGITDDRVWELTGYPRTKKGPDPDPDKLLPMFWQFGRDPANHYDRIRFSHFIPGLGPNITLVTNATVVRINAAESATAVESVEFAAADGHRWTLPVSTVIVCAGGIENARLLLSSNNVAPRGLGNDRDLVGRFLMDHLRGPVASFQSNKTKALLTQFGSFKSPSAGSNMFQNGMRLSPTIQRVERLLNSSRRMIRGKASFASCAANPVPGWIFGRCLLTATCWLAGLRSISSRTGRYRENSPESRCKRCANSSRI